MKVRSLLEVLDAAYLSKYVTSPYKTRGGILLIGPPETLRTTIMENVFSDYPDAFVLADINVKQLLDMREDISAGKITALGFAELAKIYARNPAVAKNVEGHLMAMVEEGFSHGSASDKRMTVTKARVFVVAAVTEKFYTAHFTEWTDSGFSRRFLHCQYRLENPWLLADAQEQRVLIELGDVKRKLPGNRNIRWNVTDAEMHHIRRTLKYQFQKGISTPFNLSANIYCVLKWKFDEKEAREIWDDFAECIQNETALLELPAPIKPERTTPHDARNTTSKPGGSGPRKTRRGPNPVGDGKQTVQRQDGKRGRKSKVVR